MSKVDGKGGKSKGKVAAPVAKGKPKKPAELSKAAVGKAAPAKATPRKSISEVETAIASSTAAMPREVPPVGATREAPVGSPQEVLCEAASSATTAVVVHSHETEYTTMSQLNITKPAPEWKGMAVVNGDMKQIALSNYKGKYVVFFFYPLDFTFVCPTELIAFSERVEEFRSINCEVIACSTDSEFSHLAWVNTPRKQGGLGTMNIPLLSDKTHEISKAYGVYKEDAGVSFRGLFVIDNKGNLRQITVNDMPVGRSVDETLRLVQAFQYTDKHGEVCPAGWKPGADTMKPSTTGSKSYFQSHN